jgi:hypothetical protein
VGEAVGLGAAPLWAEAGEANNAQASRIDGKSLCDTKAPLKYLGDGKTESGSRAAHASCRITPFRRFHVSEVCQRGGILLAFEIRYRSVTKPRNAKQKGNTQSVRLHHRRRRLGRLGHGPPAVRQKRQ